MANKNNKHNTHSQGMKNYTEYLKGKEPLKHTVLPHAPGDEKIHDYIKSKMGRNTWVVPFNQWQKYQDDNKKKSN